MLRVRLLVLSSGFLMKSHILEKDLVKGDNMVFLTNYSLMNELSSLKLRTQSGTSVQ